MVVVIAKDVYEGREVKGKTNVLQTKTVDESEKLLIHGSMVGPVVELRFNL